MLIKIKDEKQLAEVEKYFRKRFIDFKVYAEPGTPSGFYLYIEDEVEVEIDFEVETFSEIALPVNNQKTDIVIGSDVLFKESGFSVIAGPCAVENEEYLIRTAETLVKHNVKLIRGGANKLRTSPYTFQGLGKEGISLLSKVAKDFSLYSVTEITSLTEIDLIDNHIDIVLVGTRNMHNYQLLKEVGKLNKPVILKRGMSATVKEWLLAAEYVGMCGNKQIILCERGIRTFDNCLRNTLDLASAVHVSRNYSYHVITDPSHATGNKDLVAPMVLASLAAGVQGVMIEIHPEPKRALSDGEQMLNFEEFDRLMTSLRTKNA